MEPRISIVTLGVEDLKRSFEFYSALGLPSSKKLRMELFFSKQVVFVWHFIQYRLWLKMCLPI
jgi:catechol 2,3-dioxygenase-like lactoylglutathione lyase family enzyme